MKVSRAMIAAGCAALFAASAQAAVTADEAKQLGSTLTLLGAEKAGNADGSIPSYTGGLTTAPASFKKGSGIRPDPFASDKVVVSITSKNMAQFDAKLTPLTKELLKRNANFRVDVYPTHRTIAYPKFVLDNTVKNATSAKTTDGGIGVQHVYAGFPFPIPKTGNEAMWNHLMLYRGRAYKYKQDTVNVDSSGRATVASSGEIFGDFPIFDPKRTTMLEDSEVFFRSRLNWSGPARRAGEALISIDSINPTLQGRRAWIYLPGQRRVKLAPEVGYDTPNPGTAGLTTYDDGIMFNGAMDRYDFKLVGKQEMYVPYNAYKVVYWPKVEEVATANVVNPDLVRWENHRVWVVEATVKPGKRHVYAKRTFYLDEDSWSILATDVYDGRGQLYRGSYAYAVPSYDQLATSFDLQASFDLNAGAYSLISALGGYYGVAYIEPQGDMFFTPEALTAAGVR